MNTAVASNDSTHDMTDRLHRWANAYSGSGPRRAGYTIEQGVEAALAAAGQVDADARRIEQVVQRMEQTGRWKEARVIRAEYFMAALPEPVRIAKLKRLGLAMSRTSYYVYLAAAHAFVAGACAMDVVAPIERA